MLADFFYIYIYFMKKVHIGTIYIYKKYHFIFASFSAFLFLHLFSTMNVGMVINGLIYKATDIRMFGSVHI